MSRFVSVSYDFIDKYVRFTKPEYIQVYLYARYCTEKDGVFPSAKQVADALDISDAKAEFIFEFWATQNQFVATKNGYQINDTKAAPLKQEAISDRKRIQSAKPSYSQEEINTVAAQNKQISGLFYQSETILNKVLTASEMEMLFSFNDWLGLPVEVIMMLLSYAAKKGKTTKRYLETVAIDWADKGIDTFEAAEAYISELEAIDSAEHTVRSVLGIYDRGLTTTEKKYIRLWTRDLKIPTDLISLAYDKTVAYTGKLSWSYMDKLLQSWLARGFTTISDVNAADEEFYRAKGEKQEKQKKGKSKFNNYEETATDYKALEEEILEMMLDDSEI